MALTHPLSMQIYSGRKFPPVEAQLATVARLGFTNVETFGQLYDDVEATKRLLDAHGLSAKSGHFGVAMVERQSEKVVEIAGRLGVEIVVAPTFSADRRARCCLRLTGDTAGAARLLARSSRSARLPLAQRLPASNLSNRCHILSNHGKVPSLNGAFPSSMRRKLFFT
jgi:sugar phosphate isomerase/epimerase